MRVQLNGHEGPIPTEALPDGSADLELQPMTFQPVHGTIILPQTYMDMGYTHYEVVCVGAAGGRGGRIIERDSSQSGGDYLWTMGGAGGGGGMHKVVGALADLPDECLVIVGEAGEQGADINVRNYYPYNEVRSENPGEDGGFSSFGDGICVASGGKGGAASTARVHPDHENTPYTTEYGSEVTQMSSYRQRPGGDGGDGGIGGRSEAGGGASGGKVSRTMTGTGAPTVTKWYAADGSQGTWDGTVGKGGGGGAGGTYTYHMYEQRQVYF